MKKFIDLIPGIFAKTIMSITVIVVFALVIIGALYAFIYLREAFMNVIIKL